MNLTMEISICHLTYIYTYVVYPWTILRLEIIYNQKHRVWCNFLCLQMQKLIGDWSRKSYRSSAANLVYKYVYTYNIIRDKCECKGCLISCCTEIGIEEEGNINEISPLSISRGYLIRNDYCNEHIFRKIDTLWYHYTVYFRFTTTTTPREVYENIIFRKLILTQEENFHSTPMYLRYVTPFGD